MRVEPVNFGANRICDLVVSQLHDFQKRGDPMNPVFLSICAIVRNEAPYIGEWLEFHRLVGIERFYLYDDASNDDTTDVIRQHDRGDIVLRPYQYDPECVCPDNVQFRATHQVISYNDCIRRDRDDTHWCAFIDVDEFLYHRDYDDIRDPLFEEVGARGSAALFANWLVFGSSGYQQKPPGFTIEAYSQRARIGEPKPTGAHGKLIARMDSLGHFGGHGSHNAAFRHGCAINEHATGVAGATNPEPSADRWRLNHYYHRSHAEARARVAAIDNNAAPGFHKTIQRMRKHDLNDVEDRDILRFLPHLTEAMR